MKHILLNAFKIIIPILFFMGLSSQEAQASHFRGGQITYEDLGGGNYKVTIKSYWRSTFVADFSWSQMSFTGGTIVSPAPMGSQPPIISTTPLPDGSTTEVVQCFTINYAVPGTYSITAGSCCRIGGGANFHASSFELESVIVYDPTSACSPAAPGSSSSSPQFFDVPLFQFATGIPFSFNFNILDPDGNPQEFELENPSFIGGTPYSTMTANGFGLATNGTISWTNPLTGLWFVRVKIFELCAGVRTGAFVVREFLLDIDPNVANNQPPVCQDPGNQVVMVGQNLTFNFTANDPDVGDNVFLTANGFPLTVGATFGSFSGTNPRTGVFSWTPAAPGVFMVQFAANDDGTPQLGCSRNVQITVVNTLPPPPPPPGGGPSIPKVDIINCLDECHKIIASDAFKNDRFGISVAISSDVTAVGSFQDDDNGNESGAAYIQYRNQGGAGNWGEVRKVLPNDGAANDEFGKSVGLDGSTLIVGARLDDDNGAESGSAYIFTQNQGGLDNWGQVQKLLASDGMANDEFGVSVAVSGDFAVVGAHQHNSGAGAAYVYERNAGGPNNWGQIAKLVAADQAAGDNFGWSVAIDGSTIVVGAYNDDDNGLNSGSAYVFYQNQGGPNNWGQVTKLTASDGFSLDFYGYSVDVEGDHIIVGAYQDDDNGGSSGSAYIYNRNNGGADNWGEVKKLIASDGFANDLFGISVALDGEKAVVGANGDDWNGPSTGSAYLFCQNEGGMDNWGELLKFKASDRMNGDNFGVDVDIDGMDVIVGAHLTDDVANANGAAYILSTDLPSQTCPSSVVLNNDAGQCGAVHSYALPIATAACTSFTTTQTSGLAPGSFFPVGVTTNTFMSTDAQNNILFCCFTVDVRDVEPPMLTCPLVQNVLTNPPTCIANNVIITLPTVSENCLVASTQLFGLLNNSNLLMGTYPVSWLVTDDSGNTASCGFNVVVRDGNNPIITCPADMTLNNTTGLCGTTATFVQPSGFEFCNGTALVAIQTSGLTSGAFYPVGTTQNNYYVTNAGGLVSTCGFSITVDDVENPTITCPANVTLNNTPGLCTAPYLYFVSGSDNCPANAISQTAGLASLSNFPVGTTLNSFVNTDAAGNTAVCSFSVTVDDVEAPTLTCPANIAVNTDLNACTAVVTYNLPTATDNCAVIIPALFSPAGGNSGGMFNLGTTTVVYIGTDLAGNTATCSFMVSVSDNQNPTITCPADFSVASNPLPCTQTVTYNPATGNDNCPGISIMHSSGLASGSIFPLFSSNVGFTATDAAGNTASCTFTITVVGAGNPVITCPSNIVVNNEPGLCGATVTYASPTGAVNCGGPFVINQSMGMPSGSFFGVGVNNQTFVITDVANNTNACSFTITVNDSENPTITCPANQTVNNDAGLCSAVVNFAVLGNDNCPGNVIAQLGGMPSGAAFPVGTTFNYFVNTDASGNSVDCNFRITVDDTENPTINCPANMAVFADPGLCTALVNYTAPTFADNCPGALMAQTAGMISGSNFPVGITWNNFIVTDAAGNVATCGFSVTVTDNQIPTITCPANINMDLNAGECSRVINYPIPTGNDNCAFNITRTTGLGSGAAFPVFTTVETYVITDASGNSSACSFSITLNDVTDPTIACPSALTCPTLPNRCVGTIQYNVTGSDNCDLTATPQFVSGIPSGGLFPLGTTTNTWIIIDASGNAATCSFTVTTVDNQVPRFINCPASQTLSNLTGTCEGWVNWTTPSIVENCNYTASSTHQPAERFPKGTTKVTYTAIDVSGNSAVCCFEITVEDNEAPTLTVTKKIAFLDCNTNPAAQYIVQPECFYTDNCGPVESISASPAILDCSHIGQNVFVTLTVQDTCGNTTTDVVCITVVRPPLPVELLTFEGYHQGDRNYLYWTTASEINNAYFIVEKSLDGVNYEAIGKVQGAGTVSEVRYYDLMDLNPVVGKNHYRLKQVDFDGSFEYSQSIVIEVDELAWNFEVLKLIPNPTEGEINVRLSSDADAQMVYAIYNMMGQQIITKQVSIYTGMNSLELDLSNLANGVYNLVLDNGNEKIIQRIVKQ